jgi:malate dehydrogenase (oxaloacetate-decarboxylating)(NADP+)
MSKGLSRKEAYERVWLIDSKGLLVNSRTDLSVHKRHFAKDHPPMDNKQPGDLLKIVQELKPTALLGAAAVAQAFTKEVLTTMGELNDRPIIFALSNPTSMAECTAAQAYEATQGRCVFASGSPFPDWTHPNGTVFHPGQGNNAYIFPGVALAIIKGQIRNVTDEHFLTAAKTVAAMVTPEHHAEGRCYPPLTDIREISVRIATEVLKQAYKDGHAEFKPEPQDKEAFLREHLYDGTN